MTDQDHLSAAGVTREVDLVRAAPFSLGPVRFDPRRREASKAGVARAVQPRVMQVLLLLAARRGEVVARSELIEACWGGRIVSEDAINRCIQAIRRLSGEFGGYAVTTVARVGYRLDEHPAEPDAPTSGGAAIAAPPPSRAVGERRRVTVLCASPAIPHGRAAADPEARRGISRAFRDRVGAVAAEFGGRLLPGFGDSVSVCFGYPDALEDAAERAVLAALAIAGANLSPTGWAQTASERAHAARVGVDAGELVIEPLGDDVQMFGEALETADRLRAASEPGSVWVARSVREVTGDLFRLEPRAALLGGDGSSLEVSEVIGPAHSERSPRGYGPREASRFVGRDEELRLLLGRWARVQRGECQLVVIRGEAGIGKTRLVREFRERIAASAHTWIECGGDRLASSTPFQAVVRMLRQGLAWSSLATPDDRLEALERALGRSEIPLAESAPLVAGLLGLDLPERYRSAEMSSEDRRRRLLACLSAWVLDVARDQPLVVFADDLHWIDQSSLELLQALVEQGAAGHLLILCTARPEFAGRWGLRSHHAELALAHLSREETGELVRAAASGALSPEQVELVVDRTGGVPLFAEELARYMIGHADGEAARAVPATLQDSLAARIDQLGDAREVARVAAVLGRQFSYTLIAAVSEMDAGALAAALARLQAAEILIARGTAPNARYQFKHSLILDIAYGGLLRDQRRRLHGRAAEVLSEGLCGDADAEPEVLARHWSAAGDPDRAIAAWIRAGESAHGRHAFLEAIQSYRRALDELGKAPQTPERDARELSLLTDLSLNIGVKYGFGSPEYDEVRDRISAAADRSGAIQTVVLQMIVRWVNAFASGRQFEALAIADQLSDLAAREGGVLSRRFALTAQVLGLNGVGDLVGAERAFEAWQTLTADAGFGPFDNETGATYAAGVETAFYMGRPDLACERVEAFAAFAAASGRNHEIMLAHMTRAWLSVLLDEPEGAEAAAAEGLAIAESQGLRQVSHIRCALAWRRLRAGDADGAIRLVEQALPDWTGGGVPRLVEARRILAEATAAAGDPQAALVIFDAICAPSVENRVLRAVNLIARADLRAALGEASAAQVDLREALDLAERSGARHLEIRARLRLERTGEAGVASVSGRLAELLAAYPPGFRAPD